MSYANQHATWMQKQGSIGAALLINGAIIGGLMLTNHVVKPKPEEEVLRLIPISEKKPPKEVPIPPEPARLPPVTAPEPPFDTPNNEGFVAPTPIDAPSGPIIEAGTADGIGDVFIPDPISIEPAVIPDPIFIGAQRDPKYASRFQPIYPGALLRQDVEGKVRLRFLVGTDGRVKSVKILSASHPRFAAATEKQARNKWRFIPATRDGKAVEEWQTITVSFNIN